MNQNLSFRLEYPISLYFTCNSLMVVAMSFRRDAAILEC